MLVFCSKFLFILERWKIFVVILKTIKKANHLSVEKETFSGHLRNLQEQMSAVEEELGKKQNQYEEMDLQLADKEQRLNMALDNIKSLEELTRSSDERIHELQTQLQQVLTDRATVFISLQLNLVSRDYIYIYV